MIDHTAVRNRMMQWATFRYDMHGELLWESAAGFSNCNASGPTCRGNGTDGWDQQLLAGGNGEGTLFYPGRPDVIGGEGHIPVSSLRLVMIREGRRCGVSAVPFFEVTQSPARARPPAPPP